MTDELLISLARGGDRAAEQTLLERYAPMVKSIAARFFLSGGDREDLAQEGMVGLCAAINNYNAEKGAIFSTYAYVCARNAVADAVKKSKGDKYSALNDFVPIVEIGGDYSADPEDEVIRHENRREFLQAISKRLSSYEFKATVMLLDGMSAAEIGEALDKSAKSVDNALSRAKAKIFKLYSQESAPSAE